MAKRICFTCKQRIRFWQRSISYQGSKRKYHIKCEPDLVKLFTKGIELAMKTNKSVLIKI